MEYYIKIDKNILNGDIFYYSGKQMGQFQFTRKESERALYSFINICADDYSELKKYFLGYNHNETFNPKVTIETVE